MKLSESERVTRQLAKKVGVSPPEEGWSRNSSSGVKDGISMMMSSGYWNEGVQDQVERLATSFGMITAERYLETLERVLHPNGDKEIAAGQIDEAYGTTLDVYRRAGKMAGAYFLMSYPMVNDREGFKDQVISARDSGGPHFASWFAYYTPDALVSGVPMDQFKTHSNIVKQRSSLKYAKEFMKNTPGAMSSMGFADFTDAALDANERLDRHSAFNSLLPIVVFGPQQDVIGNLADHTQNYGEKSAGWYSFGVRTIAAEAQRRRNLQIHQPPRRVEQLDIPTTLDTYQASYVKVLESAGQTTAVFFARAFPVDAPAAFAQELLDIRNKLPRKIFNKALWLISNWTNLSSLSDPIFVLDEVVQMTEFLPEKEVMDTLNFTLGAVRKKKDIATLINPHEPILTSRGRYISSEEPDISDFPSKVEVVEIQDEPTEQNPFFPELATVFVDPREYFDQWEPKDSEAEDFDYKDPYDRVIEIEANRHRQHQEEIERLYAQRLANQASRQRVVPEKIYYGTKSDIGDSTVVIADYPQAKNENDGQMTVWELPKNG